MNPLRIFLLAALVLVVFGIGNANAEVNELWNYTTSGDSGSIQAGDISADGNYLAFGDGKWQDSGKVYFFSKENNTLLWNYTADNLYSRSIAMSDGGEYIAFSSPLLLFNKESSTPLWSANSYGTSMSVDISSNGDYIAAGFNDDTVRLFGKDSGEPIWTYTTDEYVWAVSISADGEYIAAGSNDKKLYFFHKDSNDPLWIYDADDGEGGDEVRSVHLSDNGEYLAAATGGFGSGKLYFFNTSSNVPLWETEGGAHRNHDMAISNDGKYVILGGKLITSSGNLVWNAGDLVRPSISPYGDYIAGTKGNNISMFRKESDTPLWTEETSGTCFSMSANAKYIATSYPSEYSSTVSLLFDDKKQYAVSLEMASGDIYDGAGSVDIDDETTYQIKVNNYGNVEDSYNLEFNFSDDRFEATLSQDYVTIEANSSKTVILTVYANSSTLAYGDSDVLYLNATSENLTDAQDVITISTIVRVQYGLGVECICELPDYREPGNTININFEIFNKWSEGIDYEITKKDWYKGQIGNRPEGWSFTEGTGVLEAFQETNSARFSVTISSGADAGEVVTIILLAKVIGDDNEIGAVEVEVEISVRIDYHIQIILPQSDQISLDAGNTVSLSQYVKVKNLAVGPDIANITAVWVVGGAEWDLTIPAHISLNSGEEKSVYISVKAPLSAAGNHLVELRITSQSIGDLSQYSVQSMFLSVNEIYGCTNLEADNYNSDATEDDGSCILSGCTDFKANNYNLTSNQDDGSCTYDYPLAIAGNDVTVMEGDLVQFSGAGTSENGDIILYEWDFDGDGIFEWTSKENGISTFIYNDPGEYTTTLRVTDEFDFTAIDNRIITVSEENDEMKKDPETEDPGIPSISLITSLISIGLLAIFRRK